MIGHNWLDPQVLIFKYPAKATMAIDDDEFVPLLKEHSLADIARDTSYELKEAIAAPWFRGKRRNFLIAKAWCEKWDFFCLRRPFGGGRWKRAGCFFVGAGEAG